MEVKRLLEAYQTFVRLLPRVDQVVLLKVSQLSEALLAQVALEGPLATVHSEMDLIGKQIQKDATLTLGCAMSGDSQKSAGGPFVP